MDQCDNIFATPRLDRGTWSDLILRCGAAFSPHGVDSKEFAGWGRLGTVFGFDLLELGSNAPRVERTDSDVRRDGADHYFALFPVAGEPAMTHNGEGTRLCVGDVALVDAARPATFADDNLSEPWNVLSLQLPRQALVSHLGFEPRGGLYRRGGTPAARLLLELIRNGDGAEGSACSPAASFMQLVVYDLLGALFAPSDPRPTSPHAEKMFTRIKSLITAHLADPDFGPAEVAAASGISLRYVQKLFTQHASTCSEFIYSLRLEQAARLLQRRALLQSGQPLSEIAYACGFRDYTHFARRFRRRFGHAPGTAGQIEGAAR